MDTCDTILDAAVRLYAERGARGATTRAIAEEAGVNEVTLFRHFGSKAALLREAMAWAAARVRITRLPDAAVDPLTELSAWCRSELEALHRVRSLLRTSLAEFEENPELGGPACRVPARVAAELRGYLERLREAGMIPASADVEGAARMLMGSLFAEAISRDIMPEGYPAEVGESAHRYARLTLASLGRGERPAADDRGQGAGETGRAGGHPLAGG
jgi:AcrR family transcriptional regulator